MRVTQLVGRKLARWVLVAMALMAPATVSAQDADRDGDGVSDAADLCPEVAEGAGAIFAGDGCPDADADGDGIVDDYDVCPGARETMNGFEDADGCPDPGGAETDTFETSVSFGRVATEPTAEQSTQLAAFVRAMPVRVGHVEIACGMEAPPPRTPARAVTQARQRFQALSDRLVAAGIAADAIARMASTPADLAEQSCVVRIALAEHARDAASFTGFTGRWIGDEALDAQIEARASGSSVTLRGGSGGGGSGSGGGAAVRCYAGKQVDARRALFCAGGGTEITLVMRALDASHVAGRVASRTASGATRTEWTAARVGTFDRQAVVRAIGEQGTAIQACYETELAEAPALRGRVEIRITVEPSGEVDHVAVHSDSLAPVRPAVGDCLVRIFDAMRFDPGPAGAPVSYVFPFSFEPGE
jgi:hypothetical protein